MSPKMPELPEVPFALLGSEYVYTEEAVRELHEAWRAYALQVVEECARVCEETGAYRDELEMAQECAAAIRARFTSEAHPSAD